MAYVDDSGGTFYGDIGFGGVTPGFTVHVEKSVADDKLAFFNNTSNSGYGVRFQTGTDDKYGIKVSTSTTEEGIFQVWGKRVAMLGNQTSNGFTPMETKLLSAGQTLLGICADNEVVGGDAGIMLTSDSPKITHMLYAGGGDKGWRFNYNFELPDKGGSGGTYSDRDTPQVLWGCESEGTWFINYAKPYNTDPGDPDYDSRAGKSLKIYGGGFGNAARGEFTDFVVNQVERGFRFGTCESDPEQTPTMKLEIKGTSASDPISLYVNGSLQNVTAGASDSGGSGYRCLRVPN